MIKANPTIFKVYLSIMDSFSENLSKKYAESSIENPDHFKAGVIQKIVQMFHTLAIITKETKDEVSSRCVLRGILDNVTTYCFIYDRDDKNDMMFRHYLYVLDGYICYKNSVLNGIMEKRNSEFPFEQLCDNAMEQISKQIECHPYSRLNNRIIRKIVRNANWKYESLQNPQGLKFRDMYIQIGLNSQLADYYQGYLSQFVHGLSFSNIPFVNQEQIMNVLYESIPLADKLIQSIYKTFPKEEILHEVFRSKTILNLFKEPDYNFDDLFTYVKALIRKDKTILI